MTPHIEAKKEDIAKVVIMPGDPLRALMIAQNYLTNYKIVNTVRNMKAYTGYYKNKRVTIFASGMGIPSIGIYAYELYKFYEVETIIRVGTCGSFHKNIKMLDIILADSAYSNSTFAQMFNHTLDKEMHACKSLNNHIEKIANIKNILLHRGLIITSDVFDVYVNHDEFIKNYPINKEYLASEMEAFGLFFLAKILNRKASCLLTVVDSYEQKESISSQERQNSMNQMIELALESL
ncbi:MAG: purine-nucleoside phosphorylase [Bacilli bacterium]